MTLLRDVSQRLTLPALMILPAPLASLPAFEENVFSLLVNDVVGPDYILQTTTNLALPVNWRPVVTSFTSVPPFRLSDPVSNIPSKFYRVKLGP